MEKEKVLGFDVCNMPEQVLLNNVMADYDKNIQNVIININPEIVMANYKDKKVVNIFNSQKYQIPDGIGIVYASKIHKGKVKQRITGIDFMYKLCEEAVNKNARVYLYGTKQEIIDKAKIELEKKYNGIHIVGTCNGYTDEDIVVKRIQEAKPDILFVGTGSPKQEMFIINNKEELKTVKIFMPVGGSFDVVSNTLKRAPNWITKINLEWLYRLFQEPKRFFRQTKLIKFMYCVIVEKFKNKGRE